MRKSVRQTILCKDNKAANEELKSNLRYSQFHGRPGPNLHIFAEVIRWSARAALACIPHSIKLWTPNSLRKGARPRTHPRNFYAAARPDPITRALKEGDFPVSCERYAYKGLSVRPRNFAARLYLFTSHYD